MIKNIIYTISVITLLIFANSALHSQNELPTNFKDRLWYGGGVTLGLSGGSGESLFQFGLSPMVGYKLTEKLSVGPRISGIYSYYKFLDQKYSEFSYSASAFARYKVIPMIFAHIEYEYENDWAIDAFNSDETIRDKRTNMYIGGGYQSGNGRTGYEVLVLYNTLLPESSIENPFSFRFGFNYNF